MTKAINLIFPHQLFSESALLNNGFECILVEEFLFFKQFPFHQQKIAFHRATLKAYENFLTQKGIQVRYIEAIDPRSKIEFLLKELAEQDVTEIHVIDPVDDWLLQKLTKVPPSLRLHRYESPNFINDTQDLQKFFRKDKSFFFQTTFYKGERKRLNILMQGADPQGGQWTFDADNRKKYPKDRAIPSISILPENPLWEEAIIYTRTHFSDHYGYLGKERYFPINAQEAEKWLNVFLQQHFADFGPYEDAIVSQESYLHHSVLSPLINVGLLNPKKVVNALLLHAKKHDIPLQSTEGIIRQLIGWREFIRGMYLAKGRYARSKNFWGFQRKIPPSFYDGTTGIFPVDQTIKKVLKTGYCHHIERLMVLGNFMLLCEFDPDEVYRWFMEMFIDAYDWVMVPNVYGMSQFADGGTFATKPYISGSNYLRKMSDYPKGDWEKIWDGLFWNFMDKQSAFFSSNPRLVMLVRSWEKMDPAKKETHLKTAQKFLATLD